MVEKLHAAGILCMNMCGDSYHVTKSAQAGLDAVCAQGTEAGGHTGDTATFPLVPQCVDIAKNHMSPLDKRPMYVVAAGGIVDGRGVAAALALGAEAVWVGTRFVASLESAAAQRHKDALVKAEARDTVRTLIYSGRPVRLFRSEYVNKWETERKEEITKLCEGGEIPFYHDLKEAEANKTEFSLAKNLPLLFGQGCGSIKEIKSAKDIVDDMMKEAIAVMRSNAAQISKL
jgi:NAD(P)H-dependent flavin oxidoreductase YrpB (nitropropane dioxygenase family)